MVFRGKLSAGCLRCRKKRTKCDGKTPACTQCIRAGSHCTGYRDALSMAFRDETKRFYNIRRRDYWNLQTSSSNVEEFSAFVTENSLISVSRRAGSDIGNPCMPLSIPAEEQSICFFFRNWIIKVANAKPDSIHMKTYFEDIPTILRDGSANPLLRHTVICLGKAGLAIHRGSATTKTAAELDYAVALRLTSKALNDAAESLSDQTLITVMLLGIYEASTSRQRESLHLWTKHVNGVSALLQLRGTMQFNDSFRLRLFLYGRAQLVTNCILRKVPIPAFFTKNIPPDTAFDTDAERCTNYLTKLAMRFCNSRAHLTKVDFPGDDDEPESSAVIPELLGIDLELEKWARDSLEYLRYTIVNIDRPFEDVYSNYYHVYDSLFAATIWNNFRTIRMHLNIMLRRRLFRTLNAQSLRPGTEDMQSLYLRQVLKCWTVTNQLVSEVCASVPFCLGVENWENSKSQRNATEPSFGAFSGQRLMWPLFTAGAILDTANPMRHWIIRVLGKIADLTGFQQAALMSQKLAEDNLW